MAIEYYLETKERNELTSLRTDISKLLRTSKILVSDIDEIQRLEAAHNAFIEKVTQAYEAKQEELPAALVSEFEKYVQDLGELKANSVAFQESQNRHSVITRQLQALTNEVAQLSLIVNNLTEKIDNLSDASSNIRAQQLLAGAGTESNPPQAPALAGSSAGSPQAPFLEPPSPSIVPALRQPIRESTPEPVQESRRGNVADEDKVDPKAVGFIRKFADDPLMWPPYARAVEDIILSKWRVCERKRQLFLLSTLEEKSEAYARASNLYGLNKSLAEIWTNLVSVYGRNDRQESELMLQAEASPSITHETDVENLKKMQSIAARIDAVLQGMHAPSTRTQELLMAVFTGKCHSMLRYRLMLTCKTVGQIANELDSEWMAAQRMMYSQVSSQPKKDIDRSIRKIMKIESSKPAISEGLECQSNGSSADSFVSAVQSPNARMGFPLSSVNKRNARSSCFYCNSYGSHWTDECPVGHKPEYKLQQLLEKEVCFHCSRVGHRMKDCQSERKYSCVFCKKGHKSAFHAPIDLLGRTKPKTLSNLESIQRKDSKPVDIVEINGLPCYVLLDTGADCSVVAGAVVKRSQRRPIPAMWIKAYESPPFAITEEAELQVSCKDGTTLMVKALVKRDHGPNSLILGCDYLESCKIPAIELPFGTFSVGRKSVSSFSSAEILNMTLEEEAEELKEEPEGSSRMKIVKLQNRFVARLPFISESRPQDNFKAALFVLDRAQKRMSPEVRKEYADQLYKYVNDGYAIQTFDTSGNFLPHFAVFRDEAISTNMRIVFDGSFGKMSLNGNMYKGYTIDLCIEDKLIRLRFGEYVLLADIAKAFLQIGIDERDQHYLKFLWRTEDGRLVIFQFVCLPFGLVASPAILEQCLREVIAELSPEARKLFTRAVYMDDAILVSDSEDALTETIQEAGPMFAKYGFDLHKMVTNSLRVKAVLEECKTIPGTKHKVLGIAWETTTDQISLRLPTIESATATKRYILHVLGLVYDPLGLVDPVKTPLKRLLREGSQELDRELSDEASQVVQQFIRELPLLDRCKAPRNIKGDFLIGFTDASAEAYGYCFYVAHGSKMTFLIGKSKIVPADSARTIPELELVALYLAAKKIPIILKAVGQRFKEISLVSDSKCNLLRLDKPLNDRKAFVSSKLINILRIATCHSVRLHHIAGSRNPADAFSRSTTIAKFVQEADRYHREVPSITEPFSILRVTALHAFALESHPLIRDLERLIGESWESTLRNFRKTLCRETITGEPAELSDSEALRKFLLWLQPLVNRKKASLPTAEREGILCVRTRNPAYSPVVFPDHSLLRSQLLNDIHLRFGHAGVDRMMGELSVDFYVWNAKKLARKLIDACEYCTRTRKRQVAQPFGDWPEARTKFARAFEMVAIDIFGPMVMRNQAKFYGLVMVCQATRAVKAELLMSLDSEDVLIALQIMFFQVGTPKLIFSDNGPNLERVAKDCANITPDLKKLIAGRVNWHFAPPYAPWFNGSAERFVQAVKRVLTSIGKALKSHHSIRHALAYAESLINSRVLFEVDGEAITPYYLWQHRRPESQIFRPDTKLAQPRELVNELEAEAERLRSMWEKNYLNLLSIQPQDRRLSKLYPGQKVLIEDKRKLRKNWATGTLLRTIPGADGIVRVVELMTPQGPRLRPANGLVLFEMEPEVLQSPRGEDVDVTQA